MICPDCHGSGYFAVPDKDDDGFHYVYHDRPCFECQGSGIVSCCDTAGAPIQGNDETWQDWVNSQLAGTPRKDETALSARIVELEKRVGELERK